MQALEVEPVIIPPKRIRNVFTSAGAKAAVAIREAKRAANPQPSLKSPVKAEELDKQYKFSREDWAKLEQHLREDIAEARSAKDKKPSAIRELVICAGVAYDKAFKHQTEDISSLRTPSIILDRLMILVSGDTANHVDVMPRPLETTEQSTPCAAIQAEAS